MWRSNEDVFSVIQEGMVEDSSKTVSAPLKVHINTPSGSATFLRNTNNLYKNSLECFSFPRIFFPHQLRKYCARLIYIVPSCLFFSRFCCQNLCCQNYRQTRVRHALIACLHWRAIRTAKSEYVGGIDWRSVCFFFFFLPYRMWLRFRLLNQNRSGYVRAMWVHGGKIHFELRCVQRWHLHFLCVCHLCYGIAIEIAVLLRAWSKDSVNIVIHFYNLHKEWQYILGCAKTCLLWDTPPSFPSGFAPVPCQSDIQYALHKYSQVKSPIQYNALNTLHNETFICYLHTQTKLLYQCRGLYTRLLYISHKIL